MMRTKESVRSLTRVKGIMKGSSHRGRERNNFIILIFLFECAKENKCKLIISGMYAPYYKFFLLLLEKILGFFVGDKSWEKF